MSLSIGLLVVSNTSEDLKVADRWENGLKKVAEVIKYALDEEDLNELLELLK